MFYHRYYAKETNTGSYKFTPLYAYSLEHGEAVYTYL